MQAREWDGDEVSAGGIPGYTVFFMLFCVSGMFCEKSMLLVKSRRSWAACGIISSVASGVSATEAPEVSLPPGDATLWGGPGVAWPVSSAALQWAAATG